MATKEEKTKGLRKLMEDQIADIYYAEKKLLKALNKMSKTAEDKKLAKAFADHRDETEGQVERLEKVFKALNKPAKGKKCEAIEGLIKEAKELMKEFKGDPALDAALVCAAQKVEHYEIGTYGTLVTWADELGLKRVSELLSQTLKEEKASDKHLSELADPALNRAGEAYRNGASKASSNGKSSNGKKPIDIGKTKPSRTPATTG